MKRSLYILALLLSTICLADAATPKPGDILILETTHPGPPYAGVANGKVIAVDPVNGGQQVVSSGGLLIDPTGIVVSPAGEIYVTNDDSLDYGGTTGDAVIRIDPSSGVQTVVAQGGLVWNPRGLTIEGNGNLVMQIYTNSYPYASLLRVNPATGAQTSYDGTLAFGSMGAEPSGTLLVVDTAQPPSGIHRFDISTPPAVTQVGECTFFDANYFGLITVDASGDITVTDGNPLYQSDLPPSIMRVHAVPPGSIPPYPQCSLTTISAGDPFHLLGWQGLAVGEGGTIFVLNDGRLFQVNPATGEPTLITSDFSNPGTIAIYNDTVSPQDGVLTATPANAQVSLTWSGFADTGSGIKSYTLVSSTTASPESCSAGTVVYAGTDLSYTHTGLTNGTPYYYRLCATDNGDNTSTGVTAEATPVAPISNVTLITPNGGETIPSGTTYTVRWETPSQAVTFDVLLSTNNGKKWQRLAAGISASTYPWAIPTQKQDQTKCLMKIIGYDISGSKVGEDTSNSVFTIAKRR